MIVCKGSMFKHSKLNWTVVEKEAYPIVKACHDLEYPPRALLKKHARDRLQRWAMRLCGLHFTIDHIPGDKNIWADIGFRWHAREVVAAAAVQTRRRHIVPVEDLSPLRPLTDDIFYRRADIRTAQIAASRERPRLQRASEEYGVVTVDNRLWIPTSANDLLARITVVAHCGSQGHRDQDAMTLVLKERFYAMNLDDKVDKFVRQCLLCNHFKGPRQIPRPYGPLLTPTQKNEVVHWDFLSLDESYGDSKYFLVVKDGLSHFCELFPDPFSERNGEASYSEIEDGAPFRTCVLTLAEWNSRKAKQGCPASTPGFADGIWPGPTRMTLPVACYPSQPESHPGRISYWSCHRGGVHRTTSCSALNAIAVHAGSERAGRVIDLRDIGGFVDRLCSSLHDIHWDVADAKERQRLRDMAAHKGTPVNFDVGDFPNNKLLDHWVGPFKVVAALAHSFKVEHLVTGRKYDVHASRLKFYADAVLNTTTEPLELVSNQGMFLGVVENSWEPLTAFMHDVPENVHEYVGAAQDDELNAQLDK
ncbi:hypothetical protein PHPALM_30530 [Phytophthora palmivora]|uniref:Integrase zinc-binding domain-containing protein n=1 Tax=Phytophthora palmivora TaxID=4796 RepID=A0A2P4X4W8_9STRA|nr:hypothetical protein PHPALM_30530 [Phytophthora palmivora]